MYPSNKKKKVWREEKERLLKMTLEERRKEYIRDYVSLSTILSWKEEMKSKGQNDEENAQEAPQVKKSLSEKVSLYRGDITLLEVDAIVNAAPGCDDCNLAVFARAGSSGSSWVDGKEIPNIQVQKHSEGRLCTADCCPWCSFTQK
ncbi:ADP-ribose glycohydrolase MACROD2 isoform X10 [Rattus norvegicus]|uniref:mono-ADP ribosylhydrolase 2 isoform 5 n=1 Tax=Rattus norvegicus TaxID=10116 RepID=UPI0000DA244C